MAGKTKEVKEKIFAVKVVSNTNFCGVGAGGAQFAHGVANITSERLASWYKEHEGYEVSELVE